MELFEYLMVMVSIILGLGATQALRGLSKIARSSNRYLPLTIWTVTLFYLHVQVWWALWDLSAVQDWTQLYFSLLIAIPCSLFAATELLVPLGSTPDTDWRTHFFSVRKWFMPAILLFGVLAALESYVFLGTPLSHPYRLVQLIVIAAAAAGLFVTSHRKHVLISVIFLGTLLLGQLIFRLNPGLGSS